MSDRVLGVFAWDLGTSARSVLRQVAQISCLAGLSERRQQQVTNTVPEAASCTLLSFSRLFLCTFTLLWDFTAQICSTVIWVARSFRRRRGQSREVQRVARCRPDRASMHHSKQGGLKLILHAIICRNRHQIVHRRSHLTYELGG